MSEETNDDGVIGESTEDGPVEPTSHSTSNWKVLGETAASDGTGVLGHSTSDSGATTGVEGVVDSSDIDAVGVRGTAKGDNVGVLGQAFDNKSSLTDLDSSESAGVFGQSDKARGIGVAGISQNYHGVGGRSYDSNSYGVFALNSVGYALGTFGDAEVGGNLDVTGNQAVSGHQSVDKTGLSAYRSSAFPVDSDIDTTVLFDEWNVDHFGGLDTSTGVYTVQEPGDYHVDFLIEWSDSFNEGDRIDYELQLNGTISGGFSADTAVGSGTLEPVRGFSKALFGLSQDDTIEVVVYHTYGNSRSIYGGSDGQTYLTIHKFG